METKEQARGTASNTARFRECCLRKENVFDISGDADNNDEGAHDYEEGRPKECESDGGIICSLEHCFQRIKCVSSLSMYPEMGKVHIHFFCLLHL